MNAPLKETKAELAAINKYWLKQYKQALRDAAEGKPNPLVKEYALPLRSVSKPTIPEVLPRIRAYCAKPGNDMGGSLHILLADQNVADSDVDFCINVASERGDTEGEALARTLRLMSRTQRLKLGRML